MKKITFLFIFILGSKLFALFGTNAYIKNTYGVSYQSSNNYYSFKLRIQNFIDKYWFLTYSSASDYKTNNYTFNFERGILGIGQHLYQYDNIFYLSLEEGFYMESNNNNNNFKETYKEDLLGFYLCPNLSIPVGTKKFSLAIKIAMPTIFKINESQYYGFYSSIPTGGLEFNW